MVLMGLSRKQLGRDEIEVMHLRTHAKALFWPVVLMLVLAAVVGAGFALLPQNLRPWGPWAIAGLCLVAFVAWVFAPFLRWLTTTFTLTTRRIITRRGIITKTGHDLPLSRINDVTYEKGLLDRVLGCGTLVLQTAAEDPVVLHDVPDVERVHVQITELLFGDDSQRADGHHDE